MILLFVYNKFQRRFVKDLRNLLLVKIDRRLKRIYHMHWGIMHT